MLAKRGLLQALEKAESWGTGFSQSPTASTGYGGLKGQAVGLRRLGGEVGEQAGTAERYAPSNRGMEGAVGGRNGREKKTVGGLA